MAANPSGAATNTAAALAIAAPATGTRFHVVDGIANQQVVFKVTGAATGETLYWFRNDRFIGVAAAPAPFFWTPERGRSRFVVASASGAADSVELTVE